MTRLMVSLTVAAVVLHAGQAFAQGAFPAPLPGRQAAAPANASPFPPVNGAPSASIGAPSAFPSQGAAPIMGGGGGGGGAGFAPPAPPSGGAGPSDACMKGFIPLREETERRGKLIKVAGEKKAGPDEACKLIGNYSQAELKMMKYVKENSAKCGIPPQILEQLQNGHKNTETMQKKVCAVAQQMATQQARGPAGPTLSEVLGSASAPEAVPTRKGGSTFDTLNGNVLSR